MPPTQTTTSGPSIVTTHRIIAALSAMVAILLAVNAGQIIRRVSFKTTGTVQVGGFTMHLDPHDAVITQAIISDGDWERAETAVIRRILKPGDTFVDVGANMGWYTLIGSRAVGPTGRVIAFEPAPESYSLLQQNVKDNGFLNTTLDSRALSNKKGTLRIHLGVTNKGHNSILKSSATSGFVDVESLTLDEYLSKRPGPIHLVKIDTEGAEGFILGGMTETFRRNPKMVVVMEYYPSLMKLAGFTPTEVLGKLYGLGYKAGAIDSATGRATPVTEANLVTLTTAMEKENAYVNLLLMPSL